jgi:hypothetical protein
VLGTRAVLPERDEAWGLARSVLREALALDAQVADGLAPRTRSALAGLLPEVDAPDLALDGETRRALVLAGGVTMLAAAVGDGAVLVVDDLRWADPSSVTFLASALARLPRLAGVLAFRPDELAPEVLAGIRASRMVVDVALGPLPDNGIGALVADHRLAAALQTATDRTPFAVSDVLRELVARSTIVTGPDARFRTSHSATVEPAVDLGRQGRRRAVQRRAERETGPRALVLALVALLARETTARTVAAAAALDPRAALDALSGLAAAGLVRPGERGWAPAHDLVGETVVAARPPLGTTKHGSPRWSLRPRAVRTAPPNWRLRRGRPQGRVATWPRLRGWPSWRAGGRMAKAPTHGGGDSREPVPSRAFPPSSRSHTGFRPSGQARRPAAFRRLITSADGRACAPDAVRSSRWPGC